MKTLDWHHILFLGTTFTSAILHAITSSFSSRGIVHLYPWITQWLQAPGYPMVNIQVISLRFFEHCRQALLSARDKNNCTVYIPFLITEELADADFFDRRPSGWTDLFLSEKWEWLRFLAFELLRGNCFVLFWGVKANISFIMSTRIVATRIAAISNIHNIRIISRCVNPFTFPTGCFLASVWMDLEAAVVVGFVSRGK